MAGAAAAAPETQFRDPEIMDWTILPSGVIAEAWVDEEFRARLLADPTKVLRERVKSVPTDDNAFVVVQDADDLKYALPALRPEFRDASREKIMRILDREMGGHDELDDDWLPQPIIADALTDPDFKLRLVHSAEQILRDRGYEVPTARVIVLENTRPTYHLVLPQNLSRQGDLSLDELEEILLERFGPPTSAR